MKVPLYRVHVKVGIFLGDMSLKKCIAMLDRQKEKFPEKKLEPGLLTIVVVKVRISLQNDEIFDGLAWKQNIKMLRIGMFDLWA